MTQKENRIIDKLDSFFELKIDSNYIPICYNSLEMSKVDDVIDDCFLARRKNGKNQFLFFGENIASSLGKGNQSDIENLIFSNNIELTSKFQKVLDSGKPLIDEKTFINHDKLEVRYRQKLYPLLNEKGNLEYIFGGLRWKIITT